MECIKEGRCKFFFAKAQLREPLLPLLRQWRNRALPPGQGMAGGRGGAVAYEVAPDLRVVVRPYRRGGLVRHFNGEFYFGLRSRPIEEMRGSEVLRERGVRTPEVLAAGLCHSLPFVYRGVLVVREVEGAVNLWQYIRSADRSRREAACRAAAQVTRAMHDARAVHADLNLQNYLVREMPSGPEVWIIDLDKIELREATPRDRQAAFDRLCRSMRRLDPTAEYLTLACVEAFHGIAK